MLTNKMTKQEPMFLVLTKKTIHHEGDERSRTHPGHGYPAYSEEVDVVKEYVDEESLKKALLSENLSSIRVYRVTSVKLSKSVSIDINS